MRDLDSELTGLRDALQDSIDQPATEDMIKRGRHRVRRQQAQVAAVVAIIVAAGALPFLRMPEAAEPARSHRDYVVTQDYFDTRSGFALGGSCGTRGECDSWFMTTSNGETWERRTVPPVDVGYTPMSHKVLALGTSKVVIDYHLSDRSANRYYSKDGGRTWSPVPVQPDDTIQEIPQDAVLETTTSDSPSPGSMCRDGSVIALLSDSGHSARLATQPPIELSWCQPYPDLNGTRWVAGSDPRTRQPVIASTRDRGRTWQVAPLPAFTPPPADRITADYPKVTVVSTPSASYASVINPGTTELVAIFRSNDFGATWTQTWQASDGKQPAQVTGTPVAGTDGRIRVSQDPRAVSGNVWTSADGGTTFTQEPAPREAMTGVLRWTRAGYLASALDSSSTGRYWVSYDGVGWHPVHIPIPE
jgi:hypothetical protein